MSLALSTQLVCFLLVSGALLLGALGVVLLPNVVYSAFLLGGVLLSMAGLYLLLNASFVAAAQVLVYVGAVNVLILFAIMLVNKRQPMKPMGGLLLVLARDVVTGEPADQALLERQRTPVLPSQGGSSPSAPSPQ